MTANDNTYTGSKNRFVDMSREELILECQRLSGATEMKWRAKYREIFNENKRLRNALEEINSQSVCACIAKEDECFQMLQNCAEISDVALANSPAVQKGE